VTKGARCCKYIKQGQRLRLQLIWLTPTVPLLDLSADTVLEHKSSSALAQESSMRLGSALAAGATESGQQLLAS